MKSATVFSASNWNIIFLMLVFMVRTIHGLWCYQCTWSDTDAEKELETVSTDEIKSKGDPKYENPKVKPNIKSKVDHAPTAEDIQRECDRKECSSGDKACLKWTYISSSSNNPINITYLCVTSNQLSGCYYQEREVVKSKKKHLKLEACLCSTDLCNIGAVCSSKLYFFIGMVIISFTLQSYT